MPLRFFQLPSFDGSQRTVRIYTPDAYHQLPDQHFPVAYLQDGQNMFADPRSARPETWCADRAVEGLARDGQLPWILVGVDHAVDRFGEYSPWDYPRLGVRAKGEDYARWLVGSLKPFVDHHYRTRPQPEWTASIGSSLGGLISLYLGLAHPGTFGRIGALSPTVMWSDRRLFSVWGAHPPYSTRIYLDAGAHEQLTIDGVTLDYGAETRRFHAHLQGLGYGDRELLLVLEPGGQHSEVDWRRRLPFALRWLLC
ncbi:MAG: esterase family protein [Myxococcota bacterium]|nr:esterase family protein [Myxococcota bacterium]